MDELIDVLDADGNYTGKSIMKSEAHRKGVFHPSIHVWFYTKNGEIVIQQRAKNKDTHPGLWDVSVAGHIGAGEDVTDSAIREVQEEIGLDVAETELHKIGVFKYIHQHHKDLLDCEFHHTFICELKAPLSELEMQESEVADLSLITMPKFQRELESELHSKKYVPYDLDYYEAIFQAIKKKL
ncbi:NUDIX hydrolase [Arenibacter echinorum]|uniref:Isopentenyldiphosphate isomerase n=1 Tax=Arenibacter echinorum TaxID=440515 RepID=A0A327QSN8_9FLAO|nr:NUDIX domain-containing protein [Arenibacter echinorum]RAJ07390.1 isopentenyldiphosphate isomerase [Arenibacter echinorum]